MSVQARSAGAALLLFASAPFVSTSAQESRPGQSPEFPAETAISLPQVIVTAPPGGPVSPMPQFDVLQYPSGQAVTQIGRERFEDQRAFSIGEILRQSPGVSIKQGNGPRDVGISIRGSNARNGFGIRNIQMFEDGFPVTQPDGLSRSDLTDPHAYIAIDVLRGPSSAMFGNYATGGVINFRTRPGSAIQGVELGSDFGSFGYFNQYIPFGEKGDDYEYSAFLSNVRGDGFQPNAKFNTTTANMLATYQPTASDTFTAKAIVNNLVTRLPIRLSLNQFNLNPFQTGCITPTARSGCASVNLLANGVTQPTVAQTATQVGFGRSDMRTIFGLRWDHAFDVDTVWQTQYVNDNKNINQPTGATAALGDQPSSNLTTALIARGSLFGLPTVHFVQGFFNYITLSNETYNVAPAGNITQPPFNTSPSSLTVIGALNSYYDGSQSQFGFRGREELQFLPDWTAVAALGIERTALNAVNTVNSYRTATSFPIGTNTSVSRNFLNVAPEFGVVHRLNQQWQLRSRIATGYGTPQAGNLFVTPQGVSGNNTQLQPQTNVGLDLGVDLALGTKFDLSVTGFYEWFQNEFVTQSPGAGLQNYTYNVPGSVHRGIEVGAEWRPLDGLKFALAYLFNDQFYTNYIEQLSAGTRTSSFNRAGNRIPGIEPNNLYFRASYQQPSGPFAGAGILAETYWRDSHYIDNANSVRIPAYALVNLSLFYNLTDTQNPLKTVRLFFEIQNLFGTTYVASANNIANSINATTGLQNPPSVVATTGGSIYAGSPRGFVGGIRFGSNSGECDSYNSEQRTRNMRIRFCFYLLTLLWPILVSAQHHQHGKQPPCESTDLKCAIAATPAFDADGTLWLVWNAAGRIMVARSTDLGRSFAEPVAVNQAVERLDTGPDARPKIVIDATGRVIVAYALFQDERYNGRVMVSRSVDRGESFTPPRPITDDPTSQRFETLGFAPNGDLFAFWIDKRNAAAARRSKTPYAGAAMAFSRSSDAGEQFSPARITFDNICECCRIGLAFHNGNPAIVFRNIFQPSTRDHAVAIFRDPETPGPIHRVSVDNWVTEACPHHGPTIAVGETGSIHVTWYTAGKVRQGLLYARSSDGGEHFTEPMPIGDPGKQPARPYLLANGKSVFLVWKEFDGEISSVKMMSSADDGGSWSSPRELTTTADSSDHPLLIANGTQSYLAWLTRAEGFRLLPLSDP